MFSALLVTIKTWPLVSLGVQPTKQQQIKKKKVGSDFTGSRVRPRFGWCRESFQFERSDDDCYAKGASEGKSSAVLGLDLAVGGIHAGGQKEATGRALGGGDLPRGVPDVSNFALHILRLDALFDGGHGVASGESLRAITIGASLVLCPHRFGKRTGCAIASPTRPS